MTDEIVYKQTRLVPKTLIAGQTVAYSAVNETVLTEKVKEQYFYDNRRGPRGFQGLPGAPGEDGDNGLNAWMPTFAIVADGARRVAQVADWFGGQGTKPATGLFIGPVGYVATAAQATDIRGPAGSLPGNYVSSVNGETGDVEIDKDSIGLGNVDNTSDADKPISDATMEALELLDETKADVSALPKTGILTIDFGDTPVSQATFNVTGQAGILNTSQASAFFVGRSTAENDEDHHLQAAAFCKVVCSQPVAGIGFDITVFCLIGMIAGQFKIDWVWK